MLLYLRSTLQKIFLTIPRSISFLIKAVNTTIDRSIENIIAPPACIVCEKNWNYVCKNHAKHIFLSRNMCPFCDSFTLDGTLCHEHQPSTPLQGVFIAFGYTRIIKTLLHYAKYKWSYRILSWFAEKIVILLQTTTLLHASIRTRPTYITYVPMHWYKQNFLRGYNQAEKLAEYISLLLHLPCIELVKKTTYTLPQMRKIRKKRLQQKTNYIPTNITLPENTCIILIDDIFTTGTTIMNVAKIMHAQYPSCTIWWLCISRNK